MTLLRFGVENYRSIRRFQELSLISSTLTDAGADLIQIAGQKAAVLPCAVIYGANASGKTTLLRALRTMKQHVVQSQKGGDPSGGVPRTAFAGDAHLESTFDIDFVLEGARYHYGYKCTDDTFTEEWLYSYGAGGRQTWFRRMGKDISFGKYLKGANRSIFSLTRANSLFISAAAQSGHQQLTSLYSYFQNNIVFEFELSINEAAISRKYKSGVDDRSIKFLTHADTGVVGSRVSESSLDDIDSPLVNDIRESMKRNFPSFSNDPDLSKIVKLELSHKIGGEHVFLDMGQESRGTLRLLQLMEPAFNALDQGSVLFVDEMEASLHTLISRELLSLFSNVKSNPRGAQLIFATHDTNLLCSGLLRRDQVWFAEKDREGETSIWPLTDISTRKGDNLEKGYLQGRFGAIPFLPGQATWAEDVH